MAPQGTHAGEWSAAPACAAGASYPSPAERTELMSAITWENHRARLNQGLGVRPSGFSDGAVRALPDPQGHHDD